MATGRPQEDRPKGILLMIAAVSCFALLDATAKYLQAVLPAEQVIWARFVGQLVIAAALLAWPPAGTWRSGNLKLQLLRSVFLAASTILNFRALHFLQLDVTTSIQFATPLIVTALAVPLLGERVGWRRWTAILVGFCGVLVIVNPTNIHAHWAVLLAVGTTVTSALYLITTRMLAGDDAHTTHLYTPLVGALAMTPIVPFHWAAPEGLALWLLVGFGAIGAVGHLVLIVAHRCAPAPIIAPFGYSQILPTLLLSFLMFGHTPDARVLVGGAIVLASGLYLFHRERVRAGLAGSD